MNSGIVPSERYLVGVVLDYSKNSGPGLDVNYQFIKRVFSEPLSPDQSKTGVRFEILFQAILFRSYKKDTMLPMLIGIKI